MQPTEGDQLICDECLVNIETPTPLLVESALLAYVTFYMNSCTFAKMKETICNFYTAEMINEAKKILWNVYKDDLPPMETRRMSSSREAHEADAYDIIRAISKIDNSKIKFVAAQLDQIPQGNPEEFDPFALAEKIRVLERKMHAIEIKANDTDTNLHVLTAAVEGEAIKQHINPLTYAAVSTANYDPGQKDSISIHEPLHLLSPKGATPERRTSLDLPRIQLQQGHLRAVEYEPTRPSMGKNDEIQTDATDDGFMLPPAAVRHLRKRENKTQKEREQTGNKQPQKQNVIFGSKQNSSGLRAGKRRRDIFVFNVDPDFNEDDIAAYINGEGIEIDEIEQVNRASANLKSFKVTIGLNDYEAVLIPDFWPYGIGCRPFYPARKSALKPTDFDGAS